MNESNSLEHSYEGTSVLNQFYETSVTLYVEGNDDIPFWNYLFRKFAPKGFYEMEQTHGKEGLQRYIDGIKNGKLRNVVVACDSDYACLLQKTGNPHPLIVTTYGHSIENSMFCKPMLAEYLSRLATSTKDYEEEVGRWISTIENDAYNLLLIDILNDQKPDGKSCKCLTMGFPRYSDGKGNLMPTKMRGVVSVAEQIFSLEDFNHAKRILDSVSKPRFKIIQGHFIEGAVNEFIHEKAKCSLSRNAIYGEFSACRGCDEVECEDIKYIRQEIENAVNYIQSNRQNS